MAHMGCTNHNAVLATTWKIGEVQKLRSWIPQEKYFSISEPKINAFTTVVMWPDGSNEGWFESDLGDEVRARFIEWLKSREYRDGSSPWSWIEVGYGEYGQKILQGNNKNCYTDEEYCGVELDIVQDNLPKKRRY